MKKKIKNIAIIPARIGSKRIKKKNIKLFNSKPIIEWTYKTILDSKIFDKIFVSTDSNEIIKVCKKIGIQNFIKRPKKLADDFANTNEVILHAIKHLSKNSLLENICCIYPCAVFIKKDYLKLAKRIINKNKNRFIFPVAKFSNPIERALIFKKKTNEVVKINRKLFKKRTQDFKEKFYDAGQFYFGSLKSWKLGDKKRINIGIKISNTDAIDIDNKEDWLKAEKIFMINNYKK